MKYLIENKYWELDKEYNIEKLLYLLIDRPNKTIYDEFFWENSKKQFHRDYDLPSYFSCIVVVNWHKSDKLHRVNNKPAIIFKTGYKEYWLHNNFVKNEPSNTLKRKL